jgi:DmsE family decaheme c-type cytochrome
MRPATADKVGIIKRILILFTLVVVPALIFLPSKAPRTALARQNENQTSSSTATAAKEENACATCHEQVVQAFGKTVHGKTPMAGRGMGDGNGDYNSTQTCQSCHGDGTEHMAAGGDPTKIKNPSKLKQRDSVQTCQSCHSQINEHAQWRGSKHETSGLTCLNCHSVHGAPQFSAEQRQAFGITKAETKLLKKRSEAETCYQCHSDVRRSQFQRSTHLFRNEDREQQMGCSSCHEAHGSAAKKMMRRESVNETCYQCHTEMRGPFLWDHAPVREDCTTCHKSHGSNNTNLLRQRPPMLCQQCHIQGRHQTVAGTPNSAFNTYRSCTNCHSQVHGSNHPSGINFLR